MAGDERARLLRKEATEAERVLWEGLRGRRLQGLKFLRQYPIGPFIADFCCRDRRLVVEVDGEVHRMELQAAKDTERDLYLRGQNYMVLRFTNEDVLTDLKTVLRRIAIAVTQDPSPWLRLKHPNSKLSFPLSQ